MIELEKNIENILKNKKILLVSHVIMGYPNFNTCKKSVLEMAKAGVDIIELQIPFSDPQADGSFFTKANQQAVAKGTSVTSCFKFTEDVCKKYPEINFVFMTYYNIVFKYGIKNFIKKAADVRIKGIILPDLPVEESKSYTQACKKYKIAPIFMFTPTTSAKRMKQINKHAQGFIYCQARLGVTGAHTKFDKQESQYIARCRKNTKLPLAMGFGIQNKKDVDFLKNKVDIAICCTQAIKVLIKKGPQTMGRFLKNLR